MGTEKVTSGTGKSSAEVLWDVWGVPHIFAEDYRALGYAYGWVHARAHGNMLAHLLIETRGRSAEYWGEQYEALDVQYLSDRIPQFAELAYAQMTPFTRELCDDFAEGFTAYAQQYPDEIEARLRAPMPITGRDIIAHGLHVLYVFAYAGAYGVNPPSGAVEDDSVFRAERETTTRKYAAFAKRNYWDGLDEELKKMIGSNTWAINGDRSAGPAKLVVNPHLAYAWYFRWFECHLVIESEGLNMYGANLVGLPAINVGFNDFLGWSHTVNVQRAYTAYQLTMVDADNYLFDGVSVPLQVREYPYRVLLEDGTYSDRVVVQELSLHGPVYRRGDNNTVLAARLGGFDDEFRYDVMQQVWDMMRATNKAEFTAALAQNQMCMFTTMYADVDDNIMHSFLSFTPDRTGMTPSDYASWGTAQPGSSSANLWTRVLDWEDLPYFENPPSGYLQNANGPPWATTLPLYFKDPSEYAPFITPPLYMSFREQISSRLMSSSYNATFEDLIELKMSVLVEETFHGLDDLLAFCDSNGTPVTRQACDILAQWDRQFDVDSVGGTLFETWFRQYGQDSLVNAWTDEDPLGTPNTVANAAAAIQALADIVTQWNLIGRPLDEVYGEVFNFPAEGGYPNPDKPGYPGNGGNNCFRCLYYAVPTPNQPAKGVMPGGGDTIVMVVEFSRPPRAKACMGIGNASQRDTPFGSAHINDQSSLMSRRELRDVWITRNDILSNLEFSEYIDI